MVIYGLKNCDTCRKVRKSLPLAVFFDVREQKMPIARLEAGNRRFGAAFLNTRSATWRGLSQTERTRPALELLVEYPALMKRPFIVAGDQMYLGWTAQTRAALGVS